MSLALFTSVSGAGLSFFGSPPGSSALAAARTKTDRTSAAVRMPSDLNTNGNIKSPSQEFLARRGGPDMTGQRPAFAPSLFNFPLLVHVFPSFTWHDYLKESRDGGCKRDSRRAAWAGTDLPSAPPRV